MGTLCVRVEDAVVDTESKIKTPIYQIKVTFVDQDEVVIGRVDDPVFHLRAPPITIFNQLKIYSYGVMS